MTSEMNLAQATEMHTLLTTCRPVEKMNLRRGVQNGGMKNGPACLLCEGYRRGVYSYDEANSLDMPKPFSEHFGCAYEEAVELIFLGREKDYPSTAPEIREVTGEDYYQAGKLLLEKHGYGHLFVKIAPHKQMVPIESVISFEKIIEMANAEKETVDVE